ncbi:SGNH/GDSL hydrolase family protein [Flavobacterium sufflavum]|uniref:SGNH/GDSL hydrolase family protein n=1 Tax=Flavobacterium sufflavum TaxID=1921138 RepID=A0A437KS08_9FLAO|nr:SGNH/GDSL hydrolase family protein [Flavobacterium sufflavum]RVT74875.1 SGNH/GDSL hydrolase family protein [Flavobacterium sufflavum]
MRFIKNFFVVLISFCLLVSCASLGKKENLNNISEKWVGTWATAPQLIEPNNLPPDPGLSNNTLRQIIRVSLGGNKIRLRLSNIYSKDSLFINAVSIAEPSDSCQVIPASLSKLTFGGKKGVVLSPGSDIYTDPVNFKLKANSLLAITIFYGKTTKSLTGHPGSRTTSYLLKGDQSGNAVFKNSVKTDHWYSIMNVDVRTEKSSAVVAALGNSITDGRGSGTNRQNRWTDILSQRLLANSSTENVGVLNFGIGGNCVVRGGLGPTALDRFDYNILNQSGVKWLIILEGINDIGGIKKAEDAPVMAKELIDAYQLMIDKAHARGIKVYGATILPFAKSFYDAPFRQEARSIVNKWIRTSGKFDAVIDFDRLMESSESGVILPDMHDKDYLHPNQEGYKKMGEFVNLDLFKN